MKILQVLDKLNVNSGICNAILNYYRNIDRANIQFDFLIPEGKVQNIIHEEIEALGGRVFTFTNPSIKSMLQYRKSLEEFFKLNGRDYCAVQCSYFHVFRDVFYFAKKMGIPIRIAHSHSARLSDSVIKEIRNKIYLLGSLKNANVFFAVSKDAAQGLFGNRHINQVYIIKNAINTTEYKYNSEKREVIRRELNLNEKLVIGHVGGFNRIKNQSFILLIIKELQKRHNNVCLLLVGKTGPLKPDIISASEELDIVDKVIFLGERSDVSDVLQAMDVFVFPSLHEGFGLALLEAQCAGLPCFCSDSIPAEVIITQNCTTISLKKPAEQWATIIDGFLQNYTRNEKGFNEVVNNGYDLKKASQELATIYNCLLNKYVH